MRHYIHFCMYRLYLYNIPLYPYYQYLFGQ